MIIILVVLRIFLPSLILKYANKTLGDLKEYTGHVDDIDLALIRGAYKINGIHIFKKDTATGKADSIPFFDAVEIDLSLEWRALFKGKLVGEIQVERPVINFVKGANPDKETKRDTSDFRTVIKKMMPLTVNHFGINNGEIHYVDKKSKPAIDIYMSELEVMADNLSNINDSAKILPAALKASGEVYDGTFDLNVKFNALEKVPTFDLNAKISDVNMVMLNDFFKAYGNFDVKKGSFGLYTEFAAKEGAFNGYVKPLMKDLDIVQWNKEEGNTAQILWETVVGAVGEVFENQRKDQVATKLPIKGRFDNPEAGLWTAINYVLRNAFVAALNPSIDQTIDIGKVEESVKEDETLLQKVFGKKDKTKKGNKEAKK